MKTRLIVNPVSGSDQAAAHLPAINERLRRAFGQVDISMTVAEGDGEQAARQAAHDGYRTIVVVGGDGTLNEVLNGVAGAGVLEDTVFGLVPMGTGNDFAALVELPNEPEAAADRVVAGRERRVDLGTLNDRVFVNASAGGFIAEVSDALTPAMKTLAGRFAYVIAGAGVLTWFEPPSAEVRVGDEEFHARHYQLFAICNGQTIGGGHRVAPRARIDDGLLDGCLVEASSMPELVALFRRMSSGGHLDDDLVTYRQFRTAELAFDRVVKVNTDGEVRETDTCRFGILEGRARFFV